MDVNTEIKSIREEITRLKIRLKELDGITEPTSMVCGHDIVLEHLRKLAEQYELSGLCQMAGTDTKHGWYTTNIEPNKIRNLLEDGETLREFLSLFCKKGVWEVLELAFHGELDSENSNLIDFLEQNVRRHFKVDINYILLLPYIMTVTTNTSRHDTVRSAKLQLLVAL